MNLSLERKDVKEIIQYLARYSSAEKLCKKLEKVLQPIKVSSRKDKGRFLQYWICERIADLLGIEFLQYNDSCPVHSREMGQRGADIVLRGEAAERFLYSVECKSSEDFNFIETLKQAKSNQRPGTEWLIVYKRKAFKEPLVIVAWSAFEEMQKKILGVGRKDGCST